MRKEESHEAYCGCINCRPLDTTDIPEKEDWPLFRPDEEARRGQSASPAGDK